LKRYLIIQSQDPFTQNIARQHYALAHSLREAGNNVQMLLVQNGVVVARRDADNSAFTELLNGGVQVFADSYALAEREIDAAEIRTNITVTGMDLVIDALVNGDNVIWH